MQKQAKLRAFVQLRFFFILWVKDAGLDTAYLKKNFYA